MAWLEKPRKADGEAARVVEDQTPIPEEQREYPEPVPRWVAEREGPLRFVGFVSTSEWRALQEKRKKQRLAAAHGATIVGLHFIAEQLVTTSHSLALFAGLAARVIWLRKARRRRGAGDDAARDVTRVFFFSATAPPRLGRAPPPLASRARRKGSASRRLALFSPAPSPTRRPDGRRDVRVGVPRLVPPPPRARSRAGWCPPPP